MEAISPANKEPNEQNMLFKCKKFASDQKFESTHTHKKLLTS